MKNSICFLSFIFILILDFFALLILPIQTEAAFDSLGVEQEAKFQFRTRAALVLVSFEEYREDLDPTSIPDPQIKWSWPREEEVQFRAMEIRPSLNYLQLKSKEDILNKEIRNIGTVGWISHKIGEEIHEIYIPSSIWAGGEKPPYESYRIVLMPNRELTEVFYGFGPVNEEDGRISGFKEEKMQARYYPAGRPIDLIIQKSELGESGFYYLEVGATFRSGGSTTLEIWFYHTDEN